MRKRANDLGERGQDVRVEPKVRNFKRRQPGISRFGYKLAESLAGATGWCISTAIPPTFLMHTPGLPGDGNESVVKATEQSSARIELEGLHAAQNRML